MLVLCVGSLRWCRVVVLCVRVVCWFGLFMRDGCVCVLLPCSVYLRWFCVLV